VTAHVARRRAERTLAGDLRRIDLVALDARLAQVQTTDAAEPQQFHLAEQWRARMIEEGLAAAAEPRAGRLDGAHVLEMDLGPPSANRGVSPSAAAAVLVFSARPGARRPGLAEAW